MNKPTKITWSITVLLLAIVLLSFTKCVTVTHHPGFSAWAEETWGRPLVVSKTGYSPVFICILTGIQLILLWVCKKRFCCWIGMLLNIVATAGPIRVRLFSNHLEETKYAIPDYIDPHDIYSFSWPVYLIISIGIVIIVLYFIRFLRAGRE